MARFKSCAYRACLLWIFQPCLAVVSDYCQPPLNTSDCGKSALEVFTYWKPGSRCEIDKWYGCPSLNMFVSEQECKYVCIKHEGLSIQWSDNNNRTQSAFCKERLDGDVQCGGKDGTSTGWRRFVYTYNKYIDDCVVAVWYGCPSRNQFSTIHECRSSCMPDAYQNELDDDAYQDIMCALAVVEGTNQCKDEPDMKSDSGSDPDPDPNPDSDESDPEPETEPGSEAETDPGSVSAETESNEEEHLTTSRHKIIQ